MPRSENLRLVIPAVTLALFIAGALTAAEFRSTWPSDIERVWVGPQYWANPLQDWRVANGRLECAVSGGNRNVQLLTHPVGEREGDLEIRVRLGRIHPGEVADSGWAGIRVGVRGFLKDYRNAAIWGEGLNAGITTRGELFIGKPGLPQTQRDFANALPIDNIELRLTARPAGARYIVTLAAQDPTDGGVLGRVTARTSPATA
jgi:hypothetical protein